jgi:hypothetical protein
MNAINPSALSVAHRLQATVSAKPAQDRQAATTPVENPKAPADTGRSPQLDESQSPQVPPRLLWVRQAFAEFIEQLADLRSESPMIANSAERHDDQGKAMSEDKPASRSELSEQQPSQAPSPDGNTEPASKETKVYQEIASDRVKTARGQAEVVRFDSKA